MGAGTLQIHPSARCNLRCHHCYSSSGPDRRDRLAIGVLTAAVEDAAALGYGTVAVSGGEPLLYPELVPLVAAAREAGLRAVVTTNGTLVTPARLEELAPHLDALVFSLDGPPAVHDEVRAAPWAYEKMVRGLAAAEAAGVPRGLLYTVTRSSLPYLPWAADLARHHGCVLFQAHVITATGRAGTEMAAELADQDVLDAAFATGALVRAAHAGAMAVHLDLVHRDDLARGDGAGTGPNPPVLVIEEDGVVSPYLHGFPRAAMVADLGTGRLATGHDRFVGDVRPGLDGLVARTRAGLLASDRRVVDWYGELLGAARRELGPASAAVAVAAPAKLVRG